MAQISSSNESSSAVVPHGISVPFDTVCALQSQTTLKDEYVSPRDAREVEFFTRCLIIILCLTAQTSFFPGKNSSVSIFICPTAPIGFRPTSAFPYILLVNMETTTSLKTSIPYLDSSTKSQLYDELPTSPLVLVVDSYPDSLVVKYLVAPLAKHLVK